ncbi:carboxylesterase 3 [Scleropages formosus]|uniref:Carboxylic ester hydrolase n=1 Tax=Scleropages formosus TaxID=113540 RepID=A0A8C9SQK3_SCLFO|nr:carboxylesterase 5A-like [Scleropages formosus]
MALLRGFLLAAFLAHTQAVPADLRPVVTLKKGTLHGEYVTVKGTKQVVEQYLGIPFAQAPVGALRLSAPQPPLSWEGVRDATQQPPLCLQNTDIIADIAKSANMNFSIPHVSEDCLYLNVYTPSDRSADEKLPVMVWIHGGGLIMGGAVLFDGSPLAAYQNVVMIVIQYRLGILGFFSTGDEHAKGNWGFLDQIAALQWVQENIESFGGDPKSVTIFGESAGGMSVSLLMISPLSAGLFHKAIAQSGIANVEITSRHNSSVLAKKVGNLAGCDNNTSEHLVQCLRERTEEDFLKVIRTLTSFQQQLIPGLTVDGHFMKKPVGEIFRSKEFLKVPLLLGVTNHECGWIICKIMAPPGWEKGMDKQTVLSTVNHTFPTAAGASKLIADEYIRDAKTPEDVRDAFTEMIGDMLFIIPTLRVAIYYRDAGLPVYLYEFQHVPLSQVGKRPSFVKADHADDIAYVFGAPFWNAHVEIVGPFSEEEAELSKNMMAYWANFARTGSPNGPDLVLWPAFGESKEYLKLNLEQTTGTKLKEQHFHFFTVTLPKKLAEIQAASAKP